VVQAALQGLLVGQTWIRDRSHHGSGGEGIYSSSAPKSAVGRGGFETLSFRDDGTFVMVGPGPDNRTRRLAGTWRIEAAGGQERAVMEFDDGKARATLERKDTGDIAVTFAGSSE
jgi:hypothetical protein